MEQTIDLRKATLKELAQNFKDLTRTTIKLILMKNKVQGRLEHGKYRFWLSEFISLPYGSSLDAPYLCSYLRKLTQEVDKGSCYPIEDSEIKLDKCIDKVSHYIHNKHKEILDSFA